MVQEIQQWRPSTELSITQQAQKSAAILIQPTTQAEAAKQGKLLIGQWPHANPPNPGAYSLGIVKTLEQYPFGVVEECCDPVIGLARNREFPPTVACIVEWCDKRVAFHRGMIRWDQERAAEPQFSDEHRKTMLSRLQALMHGLFARPQSA